MIIPASYNFKLIAGTTFDYRFQYLVDGQSSTTPVDLTTYSAIWTITSLDGSTTYETYSTGGMAGNSGVFFGGDTATPSNGVIDLIIVSADSSALTWNQAAYWFIVSDANANSIPLLRGTINILANLATVLPVITYPASTAYPSTSLLP